MEATITTLKDAFTKKVKDSVLNPSLTVWLDKDGNSHFMEGLKKVACCSSNKMYRNVFCVSPDNEGEEYLIDGTLLQVGNTVRSVRNVTSLPSNKNFIDKVDLSRLFRFAKDLEILDAAFSYIKDIKKVPEDLLWGCPKLKNFTGGFAYSGLEEIPENLFAKNPNLEDISYCFHYASGLKEIPGNLISKCPKLERLGNCFSGSGITSIPEELLNVFKVYREPRTMMLQQFDGPPKRSIIVTVYLGEMFANCIGIFDISENLLKGLPLDVYKVDMFKDSTFGKVQMSITQDLDPIKQRYNESKVVKKYLSDHAKEDYEKGKMDLFFEAFGERRSGLLVDRSPSMT